MSEGPIKAAWDRYAETIPDEAGETQRKETNRAFYSGACSLFWSVMLGLSDGDEETAEDLLMMEIIKTEIYDFQRRAPTGDF